MNTLDQFIGCMVGLAVGDALGAPLEFMTPAEISQNHGRVTDMLGGGWLKLEIGEYTDDTEMTVMLAESLINSRGHLDVADVTRRFTDWAKSGPKDIGIQTRSALLGGESPTREGNGGVMRCAPVALVYAFDPDPAKLWSGLAESCQITHAGWECVDSCFVVGGLIRRAITDEGVWYPALLTAEKVTKHLNRVYRAKKLEQFNSGYTLNAAALANRFYRRGFSFEDALVTTVNLGGDADTNAAVVGAALGAKYGLSAIPDRWLRSLRGVGYLVELATNLWDVAQ